MYFLFVYLFFIFFSISGDASEISLGDFFKSYHSDVAIKNKKLNWRPISYALEKDYDEVFILLFQENPSDFEYFVRDSRGLKITCFQSIIFKGKLDLLKHTLSIYQANTENISELTSSLLQYTAWKCNNNEKEITKYLISLGANPNFLKASGSQPALSSAIYNRKLELAEILLDSGADINLGNTQKPLRIAVCMNDKTSVFFLIDRGAEVDVDTIQLAATKNQDDMLELLVNTYYNQKRP
jgi:ankyrin repeat protein